MEVQREARNFSKPQDLGRNSEFFQVPRTFSRKAILPNVTCLVGGEEAGGGVVGERKETCQIRKRARKKTEGEREVCLRKCERKERRGKEI